MDREAKNLHQALLQKEKTEGFQTNLLKLRDAGSVGQDQYDLLVQQYQGSLTQLASETATLRVAILQEVEGLRGEVEAQRQELSRLDVRFKVGELPLKTLQRASKKLSKRVQRLEARIAVSKRLLEAKSAAEVAQCLATRSGRSGGATLAERAAAGVPQASAFSTFTGSWDDMTTPRASIVAATGGFVLLVSVFLRWIAVPELASFPMWDVSGWLLTVGILGGILAVGSGLLAEPRARGFLHTGVGIVALLSLPAVMLLRYLATDTSGPLGELHEAVGRAAWNAIVLREGFYFYLVSVVLLVLGGIREMGE